MLHDIRFGLKVLSKDRGYAVTAILTLAVCIGANTAIFTIVNSVLLKPLPMPESDRILLMSNRYPNLVAGDINRASAIPDYYDRLRDVNVFDEQAMYGFTNQTFEIDGRPESIRGMTATPSLFRLLRVPPALGRVFDVSEGETGNELKLILSYGLWQQLTGGNTSAIGQEVRVGGRAFTLVGVMPRSFEFEDPRARFWIPLAFTPVQKSDQYRHNNSFFNVGRLKPGATLEQAQAQIDAINAANFERFPSVKQLLINSGFHTSVERLREVLVRNIKGTLYMLWGGAAFVLLIGGVNIANLALARSNLRAKELTTRLALGAGRVQLLRQLIVESLMLTVASGVIGVAIGSGILRALSAIGIERVPRATEIHLDLTVLAAALGISAIVGIVIGLVPAAHLFRVNLSTVLHEESRTGSGGRKARTIRRVLVVAQVAFAFVLLVGSGLLLASFRNLLAADPGFNAERVVTAGIAMPVVRYATDNAVRAFVNRALQAIRSVPGVVSAGGTTFLPLSGNPSYGAIVAEGYKMKPGESLIAPTRSIITPGYFEAMSIPLVRGRYFNEHDNEMSQEVVIVDEWLARKFWPDADPIGKRLFRPTQSMEDLVKIDANTRWLTVVGVVRPVQFQDLADREYVGATYFPAAQDVPRGLAVAIKTMGEPSAVIEQVRTELRNVDAAMPLANIRTMSDIAGVSLLPRRAAMMLAVAFGAISLFLSVVGIYGVLSYVVNQRTREIGIRIALGGSVRDIFTLVFREGLWLISSGLVLGLLGMVALRRVLQTQVYGLSALDPAVLMVVIVTLGVIALAACCLPARRATRVDPVSVL